MLPKMKRKGEAHTTPGTMDNEQHIFFYKIYIFHFTKL